MTDEISKLYRMEEAAELLGISRSKLYSLVRSGEVPSIKLGAAYRIPHIALERMIEQKLEESARRTAR